MQAAGDVIAQLQIAVRRYTGVQLQLLSHDLSTTIDASAPQVIGMLRLREQERAEAASEEKELEKQLAQAQRSLATVQRGYRRGRRRDLRAAVVEYERGMRSRRLYVQHLDRDTHATVGEHLAAALQLYGPEFIYAINTEAGSVTRHSLYGDALQQYFHYRHSHSIIARAGPGCYTVVELVNGDYTNGQPASFDALGFALSSSSDAQEYDSPTLLTFPGLLYQQTRAFARAAMAHGLAAIQPATQTQWATVSPVARFRAYEDVHQTIRALCSRRSCDALLRLFTTKVRSLKARLADAQRRVQSAACWLAAQTDLLCNLLASAQPVWNPPGGT